MVFTTHVGWCLPKSSVFQIWNSFYLKRHSCEYLVGSSVLMSWYPIPNWTRLGALLQLEYLEWEDSGLRITKETISELQLILISIIFYSSDS